MTDFLFLGSKITADGDSRQKIKRLAPWKKSDDKPTQYIKIQRYHFADKGSFSQSSSFSISQSSSSHVWIRELDHKESWAPKKELMFQTVVLEKTLECPLDSKEIKPVDP